MRNAIFYFPVLCVNVLFALQAFTQAPGFKNFKIEKDNKEIAINCLYKDQQGYLFLGTDDGLYKFDGDKYYRVLFENDHHADTVTAIFQDKQQKIWIGLKSGLIANLLNKKLIFIDPEEGLPKKKITAFLQDQENNIWFSTNGEGIYFFKNKKLYLVDADDGLSDENISSLALADNGEVLAGTDEGINICRIDKGKKTVTVMGPRQGLPDYIVTAIQPAGNDTYWIGLQDEGFCLYDHGRNKIIVPPASKDWKWGQVNSLIQVQQTVWIATADNGLYRYAIETGKINHVPEKMAGKHTNNLLEDNQCNIWLSTPEFGLVKTPGDMLKLMPIPGSPIFEHIHAVLCDNGGKLWLNNEWNDLIRVDPGMDTPVAVKFRLPGLNEKTDITSLYKDSNGNIWVGTMGKGIFIVDPLTLAYRAFSENSGFVDGSVLSINGKDNKVYVSSLQGSMEIETSPGNRDINNRYRYTNFDSRNTGTNYIYSIYEDSRNRLWFATDGRGLTMNKENVFTNYNKGYIRDDRIYSVTEDRNGNIWFSTANAGIYKFDGNSFANYGLVQGLSDLNISVLKTDNAGNIVIVHKKGIDILDPLTGNVSYINAGQGVSMINAEDLGAVASDTSGNLVISTKNGILTWSAPSHALVKPTAIIESVQLFLKDIDEKTNRVFNHDENNFTFYYTGLYYTSPEIVYYKYRLEGLDSSWIITRDRYKNFPKLAPGSYNFRIQASLNKNFKNADEATYSFVIEQAFYETWWFLTCCLLLLFFIIYVYFKAREKTLKRNERLRQEKIQFQFEVLRNQVNPHFLFNSFNTLISTIEDDPQHAVEYAQNLSDFFRNVVIQRDKDSIMLKNEIDSLRSYFFLQQKRYGENLRIDINITRELQLRYKIPPLTLQLLLENAIKHNAVSKESPLNISLSTNENRYLSIKNNINHKISKQESTGMGLQNIVNRYNLMTDLPVKISNDKKYFIVSLPLLT